MSGSRWSRYVEFEKSNGVERFTIDREHDEGFCVYVSRSGIGTSYPMAHMVVEGNAPRDAIDAVLRRADLLPAIGYDPRKWP